MPEVNFNSGPDKITATLCHTGKPDADGHSVYISFSGTGPKGGYVYGPSTLNRDAMVKLARLIDEAMDWPERCMACGRLSEDCSREPCDAVIADREA